MCNIYGDYDINGYFCWMIAGTLLLMDIIQHKLECQTKCGMSAANGSIFVPSFLRVHPDGAIFVAISANKAVLQAFDIALNPIRCGKYFFGVSELLLRLIIVIAISVLFFALLGFELENLVP